MVKPGRKPQENQRCHLSSPKGQDQLKQDARSKKAPAGHKKKTKVKDKGTTGGMAQKKDPLRLVGVYQKPEKVTT